MSGWGTDDTNVDFDDVEVSDQASKANPLHSTPITVSEDGHATSHSQPRSGRPLTDKVVPIRTTGPVPPGSELVPAGHDDPATVKSKTYLMKHKPENPPALARAMSGFLHEIHTLSREGVQ